MSPPVRFGTDGIRGPAGAWPLDGDGMEAIGLALAEVLREGQPGPTVILGWDTRASSPELAAQLSTALARGGARVAQAGVLPTAAVSCAVLRHGAAAGVMITASHNPWMDNGIKILGAEGRKFERQGEVEALVGKGRVAPGGQVFSLPDPAAAWRAAMPRLDLRGLTLLLDCAHGAAAHHSPALFEEMGARLILRGCAPNGRNINEGVGALHPPEDLEGAQLAIALDGDADRVQLVDPRLGGLDGDDLLWLLCGAAEGPVVGTIMSNGGLEAALGGRLIRVAVGDRHVAAGMLQSGARVGAEPSGHVLFADGTPTGDGTLAALRVLSAVADPDGRPRLPLPKGGWTRWPSASASIRVEGPQRDLSALASRRVAEADGNRVILRYSGTEPLIRLYVEGRGEGAASPSAWLARIHAELAS